MINYKLAKVYKRFADTEDGRIILADLARFCSLYKPTFVPNDPYMSANLEGMRRVYLRFHSFCNVNESDLLDSIKQNEDILNGR